MENTLSSIEDFTNEMRKKIRETPDISIKKMNAYHALLIKEIDYYALHPLSMFNHKSLHQEIWIQGHKVLDNHKDLRSAAVDFMGASIANYGEARNNGYKKGIHKARFDIWYAQKYLINIPENDRDLWIKGAINSADEEAREFYSCGLEDVKIEI